MRPSVPAKSGRIFVHLVFLCLAIHQAAFAAAEATNAGLGGRRSLSQTFLPPSPPPILGIEDATPAGKAPTTPVVTLAPASAGAVQNFDPTKVRVPPSPPPVMGINDDVPPPPASLSVTKVVSGKLQLPPSPPPILGIIEDSPPPPVMRAVTATATAAAVNPTSTLLKLPPSPPPVFGIEEASPPPPKPPVKPKATSPPPSPPPRPWWAVRFGR